MLMLVIESTDSRTHKVTRLGLILTSAPQYACKSFSHLVDITLKHLSRASGSEGLGLSVLSCAVACGNGLL